MLDIDVAIKHCLEVAEQKEHDSITTTGDYELDIAMKEGCIQCAADHRQLAEWLKELKEAKRLLKAAVEDFSGIYDHIFDCDGMCDTCPIHSNRDTCDKWARADEALALIGGEADD